MTEPALEAGSVFNPWATRLWTSAACLILGVTCWRLGVSAGEAFRALGLLLVSILPAGYLLLGGTVLPPGERAVVAALVGFPACAAFYYLLCRLKLGGLFPWVALGLAIGMGIQGCRRLLRERVAPQAPRPSRSSVNGPVLALCAVVLLAALHDRRPFLPLPQGYVYRFLHRDDLTHQSFYWEMLRGIPPTELPYAAGLPFPPYHVLPYMLGVVLHRYGEIPIPLVHHAIAPMLHLGLFFAAVFLALRTWTGSRTIAAASLVALFFVSRGFARWRSPSAVTALDLFRVAESMSAGLAVTATVLCLLALYDRARAEGRPSRRLLLLSALMAGSLFFFKAQVFLFVGPAYVLALLALALVRRSTELVWAAVLAVATAVLLKVSWQAPSPFGVVAFAPGTLAKEMGLLPRFRGVPFGLGPLVASVFLWWQLANHPVLLPLYLAGRLRAWRTLSLGDALLVFALPGTLLMVGGLVISDVYGAGLSTMAVREAKDALWPLATLGEVAVLGALVRRFLPRGDRLVLGGALALAVLLTPVTLPGSAGTIEITPGEAGALTFLRDKTPPESVVLHARSDAREGGQYFNKYGIVSGLGGRRSVLEQVRRNIDPARNRQRDIRRVFDTADPVEAEGILKAYSVDYVLEYENRPLHFSSPALERAYGSGGVRVLAFRDPSRAGAGLSAR